MNKQLVTRLQELVRQDQHAVKRRQKEGVVNRRVVELNTRVIKEIVTTYGWPTIPMVGKEGSKNAWLLVQHADHDLKFQKKCLHLMKKALGDNSRSIAKTQLAFLTDRILVNEKKPQKFGTQFYTDKKGNFTYWPIRDIENVDAQRATYGIEPLARYIKSAKSFELAPVKYVIR